MPTVIYCHGFLSAPESKKAQSVKRWMAINKPSWQYICPALSSYPKEATQQLNDLLNKPLDQPVFCIGSSLGGFWSSWLCERYTIKAVLINPAVAPHTRFAHFIGQPLKSYFNEQTYTLAQSDLEHLRDHECDTIKNKHLYKVLLQTGDKTLDYKQAKERYHGCNMTIEAGGSHSFDHFESHLPAIFDFFDGN